MRNLRVNCLRVSWPPLRTLLRVVTVMARANGVVVCTSYTAIHNPGVSIHHNVCDGSAHW